MKNTSEANQIDEAEFRYYSRRLQNNVFHDIIERFVLLAENEGVTKKKISDITMKDAGQINRLLSKPSNMSLDTISRILRALGAELHHEVVEIAERLQDVETKTVPNNNVVKFTDQPKQLEQTQRYYE